MSEDKEWWQCPVCGSDDDEILDARDCVKCRRLVCAGCIQWCGEEHDEPNGDWFCDDCIDDSRSEDE